LRSITPPKGIILETPAGPQKVMIKFNFKKNIKSVWEILMGTFTGFGNDRGMKLSASLAYYTVFSIAPLLILIISVASIVYGPDAVQGKLFTQIKAIVGNGPAVQIQEMLRKISLTGKSKIALGISIVTLLIGASSIFIEIQDSINIIWGVKAKPKRGWLKLLKDRLLTSSLVLGLGFLLMVSLLVNAVILALSGYLSQFLPDITLLFINLLNVAITFAVITLLFAIIFKFLPDVKIHWKDVWAGAIFTSILFMAGRYVIGLVIAYSIKGSAYEAAGSIVIILLWIYYTAAILYLGAEFTRYYADHYGLHIEPADYAVFVEQKEIEPAERLNAGTNMQTPPKSTS